ncbi:hypothetical protein ACFL6K_01705 [Candidatus Latescibacterota bacterium]
MMIIIYKQLLKAVRHAFLFIAVLFAFPVHSQKAPDFGGRVNLGMVEYGGINEASGIAASRKNPGVLWTHNDSGDIPRIFAVGADGKHLGIIKLNGVSSRDWEDIAVGPGPLNGEHYIYIGEIGDNNARYDLKHIYRIIEPEIKSSDAPLDITIDAVDRITYQYPDGNRDAETLMVDPRTSDIYIVSKREDSVRVYRLPYPQSTTETIMPEHVAILDLTQTCGGDISPDGLEILIKTYTNIYYWERGESEELWRAFDVKPFVVPYIPEPQGEAVTWKPDSSGYYTISEETSGRPAYLYFYPRAGE